MKNDDPNEGKVEECGNDKNNKEEECKSLENSKSPQNKLGQITGEDVISKTINPTKEDNINEKGLEENVAFLEEEGKLNLDIEERTESGISSFKFFKDKLGLALYLFVYLAIGVQIGGVYSAFDNSSSFLIFYKVIFYIICFLAIWSHIRASFTNPGKIIHFNNETIIRFYIGMREKAIDRANKMNNSLMRQILLNGPGLNEEDESDDSSADESTYRPLSVISDERLAKIVNEYNIELTRCSQCYVVRIVRTHHCSKCKGCIMRMDHHCPWINNCIGQFNQKFFLLFCSYCLIGCSISFLVTLYYVLYKQSSYVFRSPLFFAFLLIQLILALIFIIFTYCMLSDQYNAIKKDTTLIDLKKKKFLESRNFGSVLNEVFGGGFGLNWFIPYKTGGYLPYFKKIHKMYK